MPQPARLFVIGDCHGHLSTLEALLEKLGFKGHASPDDAQLVFLGDLIDRGPDSAGIVQRVRELCDAGKAHCLLANHEFNFVNYHTETAPGSGVFRRPHNPKNDTEVCETLASYHSRYQNATATIQSDIAWFRELPIALELGSLRLVHACWHEDHLATFRRRGAGWYLDDLIWESAWQPGTPEYVSTEVLCKGVERELPEDLSFTDKNGITRSKARVCWWNENPSSWDAFIRAPGLDLSQLPDVRKFPRSPQAPAVPTLFGHYWFTGTPRLISPYAACLDFSVAAKNGGYLTAYEFHVGDEQLYDSRLRWVERRQP